ncbi:MAG: DNA-binding IclR family transcriptional regulator [Dinoroseobacter sp.]|jgi:DNA-binding IclR family transcriptional regulator
MNSADRLLTILVLFSEERPAWAADQMMAETGFTRPTLYRYLKTLCSAGLIVSTPGAGYTLGPRVTELDYLMRRADPLIAAGRDSLVALAALHPCSAFLVRWYNQRILCVASEVSAPNPRSSYPRGRPMPLARGAISRALLAFLSKREQEQIGDANLTEFARTGTGETVELVRATLRRVRRDGFAVAHGEVTPGVVGIAAPIFDGSPAPIAALCFTAQEDQITADQITMLAGRIRDFAQQISTQLSGAAATRKTAWQKDAP